MTKILCEYTPCFKPLLSRYDVTYASVYGAVWRYCQGEKHICTATIAAIAERAGVSGAVVAKRLNVLEEDGWIESKKVCMKVGWRKVMHIVIDAASIIETEEEVDVSEIAWQHPDAFETPSPEQGDTTPTIVSQPPENRDSLSPEQKKESIKESFEESSKETSQEPSPALLEYYKDSFGLKFVSKGKRELLGKAEEEFGRDTVEDAILWASAGEMNSNMNRIYSCAKTMHSRKGRPQAEGLFENTYDWTEQYMDEADELLEKERAELARKECAES